MIYLINFGSCYKIGITNDLKKRLSTFKTSREKVEVEDLILTPETELDNYSNNKYENELHELCKNFNIERELFNEQCVDVFRHYKYNVAKDYINWKEHPLVKDINDSARKYVIGQYNLDKTELINIYESIKEIPLEYSITGIKACLGGSQKTSGGFIWEKLYDIPEHLQDVEKPTQNQNLLTKITNIFK